MCAQGLRSSALLCGKSASKNTVFLPPVRACVCFRAQSDPLAVSQTARRAAVAPLLFADSSPATFSLFPDRTRAASTHSERDSRRPYFV